MAKQTESQILSEIIALSNGRDLVLFRQQSGLFYTQDGRPVTIGFVGCPDVFGCYKGRAVWIETKNGKNGEPSPEQSNFICKAIIRGEIAFIARSKKRVEDMLYGPTNWHQWTSQTAHVVPPVPAAFPWAAGKYFRQTGRMLTHSSEFHRYQARLAGVPEKHILEIIP